MTPSRPVVTEEEFWRDYKLINDDIYAAILCCYTNRAINKAASSVGTEFNHVRSSRFWELTSSSLHNTLFVLLHRILDKNSDFQSIHKLLNTVIGQPELFSKASLRARKRKLNWTSTEPEWLDEFVQNAWEPTSDDLGQLKKALVPYNAKFDAIYKKIRHHLVHLKYKEQRTIEGLYEKTRKKDIDELLCFLHNMIKAIQDLADNGNPPKLVGDNYQFAYLVRTTTEETMQQLLAEREVLSWDKLEEIMSPVSPKPHKLEPLFDKLAADLSSVDPSASEVVQCPMCDRRHTAEALPDQSEKGSDKAGLSKEHIIPGALGGKEITLTCSRCNNTQGSSHDAQVGRMVAWLDWWAGSGEERDAKFLVDDLKPSIKMQWSATDGPNTIKPLNKKPEAIERLKGALLAKGEGDVLKFSVPTDFDQTSVGRGLLRMAYLVLFHHFGYKYILSVAGQKILALILAGTDEELRPFLPQLKNVQDKNFNLPFLVLPLRYEGVEVLYLVILRFETSQVHYYAVLMPGPALLDDPDFVTKMDELRAFIAGRSHDIMHDAPPNKR